jgi:hypothetical protein
MSRKPSYCGLNEGDIVEKKGGDYYFKGTIQCIFTKLNGVVRVVVENNEGVLHIFNPGQLSLLNEAEREALQLKTLAHE